MGANFLGDYKITNNKAEYQALINGLYAAVQRGITTLTIAGDSALVRNQLLRRSQVNTRLRPLVKRAWALLDLMAHYTIHHVYRRYNKTADALANYAIDDVKTTKARSRISQHHLPPMSKPMWRMMSQEKSRPPNGHRSLISHASTRNPTGLQPNLITDRQDNHPNMGRGWPCGPKPHAPR